MKKKKDQIVNLESGNMKRKTIINTQYHFNFSVPFPNDISTLAAPHLALQSTDIYF